MAKIIKIIPHADQFKHPQHGFHRYFIEGKSTDDVDEALKKIVLTKNMSVLRNKVAGWFTIDIYE